MSVWKLYEGSDWTRKRLDVGMFSFGIADAFSASANQATIKTGHILGKFRRKADGVALFTINWSNHEICWFTLVLEFEMYDRGCEDGL